MLYIVLALATFILGAPASAYAFEEVEVPKIVGHGILAQAVVSRDAEAVCPTSSLPNVCRREFALAKESFEIAESVLRLALILRPLDGDSELLKHAERLHERGWYLYTCAIAEYATPPLLHPDVAEGGSKKR